MVLANTTEIRAPLPPNLTWKAISLRRYDEMLDMLPPAYHRGHGFLMGEAWTHDSGGAPAFRAFINNSTGRFEASHPLTIRQFKGLNVDGVGA